MDICSIKLKENGTKGAVITYRELKERGGLEYIDEKTLTCHTPVPDDCKQTMQNLLPFIVKIYGYNSRNLDELCISVTGVVSNPDNDGFMIIAQKKSINNKTVNLLTPYIIPEDEYPDYSNIMETIDKIFAEVKLYLSGEKAASPKQILLEFNKTGKVDVTAVEVDNEGAKRVIAEYLSEKGKIISKSQILETV